MHEPSAYAKSVRLPRTLIRRFQGLEDPTDDDIFDLAEYFKLYENPDVVDNAVFHAFNSTTASFKHYCRTSLTLIQTPSWSSFARS